MVLRNLVVLMALLCAGCASYLTPGGGVRLADLNQAEGPDALARLPSPPFPARLAVVRVQAPEYSSRSSKSVGEGRFSVVTSRELLGEAQIKALSQWTAVDAVSALDPMLLPAQFKSLDDLRLVAAKLQADILLIVTVDTRFQVQDRVFAPSSKLPLGDKPDTAAHINSTASLAFTDVRTGFNFGSATASTQVAGLAEVWSSGDKLDQKRLEAEQQAFKLLVAEAEKTWAGIAERYQ